MASIVTYDSDRKGVLARFTFANPVVDRAWVNNSTDIESEHYYNDEFDIGFDADFDYDYTVESFDNDALEGKAWIWITENSDVALLKAHSSFVGTRLLKDGR